MVDLSARVKEQFTEKMAQFSDADLQDHPKVVAFKDSIRNCDKGKDCTEERWRKSEQIHCQTQSNVFRMHNRFDNSCAWTRASQLKGERVRERERQL